ncbi:hypothetical protein V2J09_015720 [Rumex salicifolius]
MGDLRRYKGGLFLLHQNQHPVTHLRRAKDRILIRWLSEISLEEKSLAKVPGPDFPSQMVFNQHPSTMEEAPMSFTFEGVGAGFDPHDSPHQNPCHHRRHHHQLSLNARQFVPTFSGPRFINPGQPVKRMGRFEPHANGFGDVKDLEEMFSKLNPMAEEFVPPSLTNPSHGFDNGFYFHGFGLIQSLRPASGGYIHSLGRRGQRRTNARTPVGQRKETVRRTVFVSDVDHQVTEEQLAALFINCGQVVDCRICGDPNSVLRFAFVEFTDEESAEAALTLSGTMLGFYPVKVTPSKTAIVPVNSNLLPQNESERDKCARTVYCTNIDNKVCSFYCSTPHLVECCVHWVSHGEVKLFFESVCGKVLQLRLLGDHNHSTRIAFVEFAMAESAIAALNCSGVVLGLLPIRVSPSKTPVRPRAPRVLVKK